MRMRYIYIITLLTALSACEQRTDWYPYFESQHKTPYGTKVLQEQLGNVLPDTYVEIIKSSTDELLAEDMYEQTTYMYINPQYYPDSSQTSALLNFTQSDNGLFIATTDEYFNPLFTKFKISLESINNVKQPIKLNLIHLTDGDYTHNIKLRDSTITYFHQIPDYATVLGTVEVGDSSYPNYIGITVGGENNVLYLHSNPELFSNYHMLKGDDGRYALNCLSNLYHTGYFLWDGFGTKRRYSTPPSSGDSSDLLRYIWSNPALKYALLTLMAAFLLFFLLNYKRVVRSIPVFQTRKNSSIGFMKMVATLFMQEENHIHLARYRVNYFLDKIKEQHFIDFSQLDEEFTRNLAVKTQLTELELRPLITQLTKVKNANYLNEKDFFRFSKIIESFIQKLNIHP